MFNSIVVAFDGSPQAEKALKVAAELAAQNKARLGLIYVIDSNHMEVPPDLRHMLEVEHVIQPLQPSTISMVSYDRAPAEVVSSLGAAAAETQRNLNQLANYIVRQAEQDAREAGAENVETTVDIGNPADRLLAYAEAREADLIISGRRGFSPLKSLMLGSTSHKISQLAECSCLTVR